jgi:hypothetical protein
MTEFTTPDHHCNIGHFPDVHRQRDRGLKQRLNADTHTTGDMGAGTVELPAEKLLHRSINATGSERASPVYHPDHGWTTFSRSYKPSAAMVAPGVSVQADRCNAMHA